MSKDKFRYSYAAPTQEERREIESIRARYRTDAHAENLARLRLLDGRVRRIPMLWALLLGIVGVLLFGLGMAMVLEWEQLAGGIAVSAAGSCPWRSPLPSMRWLRRAPKRSTAPRSCASPMRSLTKPIGRTRTKLQKRRLRRAETARPARRPF